MESRDVKELVCAFKDDMLCQFMDEHEMESVAPYFELVEYPVGGVIFREGDSGDFLGFVVRGKLEVTKQTEFKGKKIVVAILSRGSFVGELSLFDGLNRSASVVALEDTALLVLKHDSLEEIMERYPHAGVKMLKAMIKILAIRLRRATERLTAIF